MAANSLKWRIGIYNVKLAAICQLPIEWANGNWQLAANFTDIRLKWDFIAFKMNIISLRKCIADTDVVNDGKRVRTKVLLRVWSYDFYYMTLSTE